MRIEYELSVGHCVVQLAVNSCNCEPHWLIALRRTCTPENKKKKNLSAVFILIRIALRINSDNYLITPEITMNLFIFVMETVCFWWSGNKYQYLWMTLRLQMVEVSGLFTHVSFCTVEHFG